MKVSGTRAMRVCVRCALIGTLVVVAARLSADAVTGDVIADHLLGQANFTSNNPFSFADYGVSGPQGMVADNTSTPPHLYISDTNHHRVLGYYNASTLITGQGLNLQASPPDILIGQPDFVSAHCNQHFLTPNASTLCFPKGMAVDASGNLYVADSANNRVLVYAAPFKQGITRGFAAEYVYGQGPDGNEFTTGGSPGPSQSSLFDPTDVTVDSTGNVFIADALNNRVILFFGPTPGTIGGALAALVWGQGANLINYTSAVCANGVAGNPAASLMGMCGPGGVSVVPDPNIKHADDLYVADTSNHRTLVFSNILGEGTPISAATQVYGQPNGTSNTPGGGAGGQKFPTTVRVVNAFGGLFMLVADTGNNRVLSYNLNSFSLDAADSWGTGTGNGNDFTDVACNNGGLSANSLCNPIGIAFSGLDLYVADDLNNRVLKYSNAFETANVVIGQPDFTEDLPSYAPPNTMVSTNGVVVDTHTDPPLVFVADTNDNRVLGFPLKASPFDDNEAATYIIGQSGLGTQCNQGQSAPAANSLCAPGNVAIDPSGNLWVADSGNNRVLEFSLGNLVARNEAASLVLGQGLSATNFTANAAAAGQTGLMAPEGVTVDSHGNVYVADTNNQRVLEFNDPIHTDVIADLVYGQPDFDTTANNQSSPAANTLVFPVGVSIDGSGNLWITDTNDCRVLEFDEKSNPPANTAPRLVFGQGAIALPTSFLTNHCDLRGAGSFFFPFTAILDPRGNLFVSDSGNNRVLEFDHAETGDGSANRVFGAGPTGTNFTLNGGGVGNALLQNPFQIAFDPSGNLYAADSKNNRVVEYDQPVIVPTATPTATATRTPTRTPVPTPTRTPARTATRTPTPTPTHTHTPMPTHSATRTPSRTPTHTSSRTPTPSPTHTAAPTHTATHTPVHTATRTPTHTPVPTHSATHTPTRTATPTPHPTATPTPALGLDSVTSPIQVGGSFTARGNDFNAGSVVNFFIATAKGPINAGPLKPSSFAGNLLVVPVNPNIIQGAGFVAVQVVNTTQGFITSNALGALLQGSAGAGLPSVTGIDGQPIAPDSTNLGVALANVDAVVPIGKPFPINGSGFDTVHGIAVDVFCSCPGGKVGPFFFNPGQFSATQVSLTLPASGMNSPVVGPGSFRVSNRGADGLYSKQSASVAAPIGAAIMVSKVTQSGGTITVIGTGFGPTTVINLFNAQGTGVVNLGGLNPDGSPRIALTPIDSTSFSFAVPAGAVAGPAYVQALNPPFVPFSSSGNDPGGAFTLD